jgi:hypothetical protein
METLNTAFFFVTDKIIDLQVFFLGKAWGIGRFVLIVSISLAAINYALLGQGLRESLVKISKAVIFFFLVMGAYPWIISYITQWTFQAAYDSTYPSIAQYAERVKTEVSIRSPEPGEPLTNYDSFVKRHSTPLYTVTHTTENPYFTQIIKTRRYGEMEYSVVSPAAVMEILLIVAGDCLEFAEKAGATTVLKPVPDFAGIFKGFFCGFAVLLTGIFAMIEYLLAYLEFMLVTSVGIILFPLSLWEGTKFMAEKLIGAIMGFFIKLLFCNICIFLLLFGYVSLIKGPTFQGTPEEILVVLFISLIFFYICKSAPGLAQSLLTGSPTLSAAGAIGAVAGAVAAGASVLGLAKKVGGTAGKVGEAVAGGAAKTAFAGAGAVAQAAGAAGAVKTLGGSRADQAMSFLTSMGGSAKEAALSKGSDLVRSLTGGKVGGGAGGGLNRHSRSQIFQNETVKDPETGKERRQTHGEYIAARYQEGTDKAMDFMAGREKLQNMTDARNRKGITRLNLPGGE